MSSTLNSDSNLSLMLSASTGNASGKNLGSFRKISSKLESILIIYVFNLLSTVCANLFSLLVVRSERLLSLTFGSYVIQSRVEENFAKMTNTPFHFSVRYDMIAGSVLCLRSRQIGDRLQMSDGHSRSLKKLMIEGKIPRRHRDGLPIFTYGSDVVAAAGLGVSHPYVPKEGEPALSIHIDILKEETT